MYVFNLSVQLEAGSSSSVPGSYSRVFLSTKREDLLIWPLATFPLS